MWSSDTKTEKLESYYGREIRNVLFGDDRLSITFNDGITVCLYDNGHDCCELRYMSTDDEPLDLIGKKLRSIEAKKAPNVEAENGVHEIVFLEICADNETVTFANHNENSGFYCGFSLTLEEVCP